ncbi:MAG: hypothetical protein Tsb0019_01340 [Roseibium sp.]
MRRPFPDPGMVLALSCWLHWPAMAGEAVPAAKPLGDDRSSSFVEGVDVPRGKPVAPNRATPETGFGSAQTCTVPGARMAVVSDGEVAGRSADGDCGIADPVNLEGVFRDGAELSFNAPALVSCDFARVVTNWLLLDVLPAADDILGEKPVRLATGPGYQCRRRNNQPDGKLSEHALGNALDISHLELANGESLSIERHWAEAGVSGRFLKRIHEAACKRFTTVLGPDADPDHRSHIHLDTGCHGSDCTFIICQ